MKETNPRWQNFPEQDWFGHRKAVCRRCKIVIRDGEPSTTWGEFYHPVTTKGKSSRCPNQGKEFGANEYEIEPFLRKRERRRLKRNKQKA